MKNRYLVLIYGLFSLIPLSVLNAQQPDSKPAGEFRISSPWYEGKTPEVWPQQEILLHAFDFATELPVDWDNKGWQQSPEGALSTNTTASYSPNVELDLITAPMFLPAVAPGSGGLRLELDHWFHLESYQDEARVEIRGADGQWITLITRDGYTFKPRTLSLKITDWAGQQVQIRLRFRSNAEHEGKGWHIQALRIVKIEAAEEEESITTIPDHAASHDECHVIYGEDSIHERIEAFERWMAESQASMEKSGCDTNATLTIPVVVHLLHYSDECPGNGTNLSDQHIKTTIAGLNNYFKGKPPGATANFPDSKIVFQLAQRDPEGKKTNGIERIPYPDVKMDWKMKGVGTIPFEWMEYVKKVTIWNPNHYMNIWVADRVVHGNQSLNGYAWFPSNSTLDGVAANIISKRNTDGVVCYYNVFGSNSNANRKHGSTLPHEVGHYLGLHHVWGPSEGCQFDDYCLDTDTCDGPRWDCPSQAPQACKPGTTYPISNLLSYTSDDCRRGFTNDQITRMRTTFCKATRRRTLPGNQTLDATTRPNNCFTSHCRLNSNPCMNVTINKVDASQAPRIRVNVTVKKPNGDCIEDLKGENFFVCDDGATNWRDKLEAFKAKDGLVDLVFVMDNSGSMADEIDQVRTNVASFMAQLKNSGLDYALGLCRYGGFDCTPWKIENGGVLITDADEFRDRIWSRNVSSGSQEDGFGSINTSAAGFRWRKDAQKVMIIITDETPQQGSTTAFGAINGLLSSDVTLYAFTTSDLSAEFLPVTNNTGGQVFDILTNFTTIFDQIGNELGCSYNVYYNAEGCNLGNCAYARPLEIGVELPNLACGCVRATTTYKPSKCPQPRLSNSTRSRLAGGGAVVGGAFEVLAEVSDDCPPYPEQVFLYYRTTGDSIWQFQPMVELQSPAPDRDGLYRYSIPGSYMQQPGVDFFVTCSDGNCLQASSAVNPYSEPHQMPVGDNELPKLSAMPVCAGINDELRISVEARDFSDYLTGVKLHFKPAGEIKFQELDMRKGLGNIWTAILSRKQVSVLGMQYYISATDNHGLTATMGSSIDPLVADFESQTGVITTVLGPEGTLLQAPDGYAWEWYRNGGLIPGPNNKRVIPATLPGFYQVLISREEGCLVAALDYTQTISGLDIYPNPTTGTFRVDAYFNGIGTLDIKVYDNLGKLLVHNRPETELLGHSTEIDLSNRAPGVYYVEVRYGYQVWRRKIILRRP